MKLSQSIQTLKENLKTNQINICVGLLFGMGAVFGYTEYNNIPEYDRKKEKIDFFDPTTLKDKIKETNSKKLVLLICSGDFENTIQSNGIENYLKHFEGIQYYVCNVNSVSEFCNAIRDYSLVKSISSCIIFSHGSSMSMDVGDFDSISEWEVEKDLSSYRDCFEDKATMLLYSCSTASGDFNIAKSLSETLCIEVTGPSADISGLSLASNEFLDKNYKNHPKLENLFLANSNGNLEFNPNKFVFAKTFMVELIQKDRKINLGSNFLQKIKGGSIISKEFLDLGNMTANDGTIMKIKAEIGNQASLKTYKSDSSK